MSERPSAGSSDILPYDETPPDEDDEGEDRPRSGLKSTIEWAAIIVGALVVALVIKATLLQAFYIPTESMDPTLKVHDRVLVNKLSYRLHDVHRGDIVVFERPDASSDPEIKDLIKRVIALPGETIEADARGRVLIDGDVLDEPYLQPGVTTRDLPRQVVPPDHYWVMGDNRGSSRDSRAFRAIDESLIVGRAFIRVWPLQDITLL